MTERLIRPATSFAGTCATALLALVLTLLFPAAERSHAQEGRGGPTDSQTGPERERGEPRVVPRRGVPKDGKSAEAAEPKPIPKSMRRPGANAVPEAASERAKLLSELYAHLAT